MHDCIIPFEVEHLQLAEQPFDETKPTLLIIEGDAIFLTNMIETLQKKFNIHFALNGEQAMEKLEQISQLDLIVSDIMMNQGNGHFLYQYISKRFGHVPFIFLTTNNTSEARIAGLASGAIDYICKPVYIAELEIRIISLLNNLLNQRNALIVHAYQSMIKRKIQEPAILNTISSLENVCLKYNFTKRETEVIRLLTKGKMTREIANNLFISVETVRKHLQNTYDKVGVSSKFELLKKLEDNSH